MREVSEDFGEELRRRRLAAGLSLNDLSARVHYSRGHLSKVENNKVAPSKHLVRLSDAALDAGGELIAFTAETSAHGPDLAAGPPSGLIPAWPYAAEPAIFGGLADVSPAQADSVVRSFGGLFDQIRVLSWSVDPRILLPGLWAHAHTLRELAVAAGTATRQAALLLAARYADLAGWMAQEAGDDHAALRWAGLARSLADAGGDNAMGAYSFVRHALIAMYRGDARATIELARRTQAQARIPSALLGLAALREAQGHALAGDPSACRSALDRASDHYERAARVKSAQQPFGSVAIDDPVAMAAAWCLYDLGKAAESAAAFEIQIARVPAEARRARTRFSVRQALAYAVAGEVDHACALTRRLLPDIRDLASATIRHDLRQLARTFRRWHSHGPVREVLPGLDRNLREKGHP